MKLNVIPEAKTPDDAGLVALGLDGNREAFGQLVARHQSAVCALAYSACGNIAQSEDLAQETFIIAWRKLADLKEPAKFRSWLYGIARNLIHTAFRKQTRNPLAAAEPLDEGLPAPAAVPNPAGHAISREEQQILWRSLEHLPETYREPLVLFYRENESIERVAQIMELSEEAARQRLSRGRKLLQEQVQAFVEGALRQTGPGPAFTLSVLAALPAITFSAKAATLGVVAKGGAAVAKGATLGSFLSVCIGPAIGVLMGYWGFRESRKYARTPGERQFRNRFTMIMGAGALAFCGVLVLLVLLPDRFFPWQRYPLVTITLGLGFTMAWCIFVTVVALRFGRVQAKLREEERRLHPELFRDQPCAGAWPVGGEVWEYRSRATLLGLPLVHCRFGNFPGQKSKPAVGWIACGDRAFGILFASGAISVGGISMGGISFGLFSCGGMGFGLLTFGGFTIGAIALGGAAIGIVAAGGIALGWHAAIGGMAVAREFALGGGALAHHINDPEARNFFNHYYFLNILQPGPASLFWICAFAPGVLQIFAWRWWQRKLARRMITAGEKTKTVS